MDYLRSTLPTPNGNLASFDYREGTSDLGIVVAILTSDEYRLKGRPLSGWALDVGAHIGTASVVLSMDNPNIQVAALEPIPENVELIRRNLELNNLSDRVMVIQAAAGKPGEKRRVIHYGYDRYQYWMGGLCRSNPSPIELEADCLSLDDILDMLGIKELDLLKIDCEGCEWSFLDSPQLGRIKTIIGECHTMGEPYDYVAMLHQHLDNTHSVELTQNSPDLGHFEATRK